MTNSPIRVILIDDHIQIHLSLIELFKEIQDIELIAQGSSGQEAISLCEQYKPDILLMDVIMQEMSGIEATKIIHQHYPSIKIVALSGFMDQESIKAMLDAGAKGYILKTSNTDELANTLRTIHSGNVVFSQKVSETLLSKPKFTRVQQFGLTRRETEVLRYLAHGLTNAEISQKMVIGTSTVKFHVGNILKKLDVQSRTQAVFLAIDEELV